MDYGEINYSKYEGKLRSCPICGSNALFVFNHENFQWIVNCSRCGYTDNENMKIKLIEKMKMEEVNQRIIDVWNKSLIN